MKAMIFAAGIGSRLKPLTDHTPKALVELRGLPLLQHQLNLLKSAGIREIVINIHHHAEIMLAFIEKISTHEFSISVSDETDQLLDTGGGLKKAAQWLTGDEAFFVLNADVICNFDLLEMHMNHLETKSDVSLAVTNRSSSRQLLFDSTDRLCGWKNEQSGELKRIEPLRDGNPFSFSGIHLINPSVLSFFGDESVFSIIDFYLNHGNHLKIQAFHHQKEGWFDLGDLKKLEMAERYYQDHPFKWERL